MHTATCRARDGSRFVRASNARSRVRVSRRRARRRCPGNGDARAVYRPTAAVDDERHPLPAGWVGCRLEAEAEATRQVELASAPDDRQQPGNPTEPLLLRATSGRLRRPSADAAWDEERKRCADSTALSPRRGKRTSGSRRPAPLWTNRKRARRTRMSGRDLRSFCVVARRVRGQSELGLNRLEIIARHRISGRFWLFRRRVEKSVCSRRRFGAKPDNELCRFAGIFTGATGLEPATSGVTGRRSNQLNYAPEEAPL
jgi:hypothetical protein